MKLRHLTLGAAGLFGARLVYRALRKQPIRGKLAVVMGASRGFGLDVARVLSRKGALVAICARNAEEIDRARSLLQGEGAQVFAQTCDASSEAEVTAFLAAAAAHFHADIDTLITNAATISVGPLENTNRADYEEALRQILWTTYVPTMAVLPAMRARKSGRIVHVTSFGGRLAVPHLLPYSAAKFAATGFSEGLRAEVAKDGISVTTITPSLMRTGSYANAPFKGQKEKEFLWFTAGDKTPLLSNSSMRIAKGLVDAVEHRDVERSFSLIVRAAVLAKALSPALVAGAMAIANRLLPGPDGVGTESKTGKEVVAESDNPLVHAVDAIRHGAVPAHNE